MGRGEERNPRSDNPGATTVKTRRHPFARGSSLLYFRIQEFTVAIQPLSHSIHGLHTLCIPCATTAARYRATSRLAALHFTCVPTRTCRPHYMISHRYGKARFPHYSLASSSPFLSVPIPSSLSISFSIHSSFIPRVLCLLPSVSHWLTLSHSPSLSLSLSLVLYVCLHSPLDCFLTFPFSISDNLSIKRLPRRTPSIFLGVASLRLWHRNYMRMRLLAHPSPAASCK